MPQLFNRKEYVSNYKALKKLKYAIFITIMNLFDYNFQKFNNLMYQISYSKSHNRNKICRYVNYVACRKPFIF